MGDMSGVKKQDPTTVALLCMPSHVDPIFRTTIPVVKQWLQILWGHELPMSKINTIWASYKGLKSGIGGWRRGKWPWAALELTLNRIQWTVQSPTIWEDRMGCLWNVHVCAPRDVLLAIHRDIQQYILGRVQTHGGFKATTTWWGPSRV